MKKSFEGHPPTHTHQKKDRKKKEITTPFPQKKKQTINLKNKCPFKGENTMLGQNNFRSYAIHCSR